MITLDGITKIYQPKIVALDDVNLEIQSGEFASIVGPSGAGKSTLVRLLIAQEKPTKGKILIGGRDISHLKSRHIPYYRRKLGVVWQDFKLLSNKTVFENVAYALEVVEKPIEEIRSKVPQILRLVGLEGKEERFPRELSGGEVQRTEIVDLLLKINSLGTTVLLATHNKDVVNNLKRRVIVLEDGKVISDRKVGKYAL